MHPDLLRALAKARHEELIGGRRTRTPVRVRPGDKEPRFARPRRWVGSLFISVGARLVGDQRAPLEFGHE